MERYVELKVKSLAVKVKLLIDLLIHNRIVLDIESILKSMGYDVPKKKKR